MLHCSPRVRSLQADSSGHSGLRGGQGPPGRGESGPTWKWALCPELERISEPCKLEGGGGRGELLFTGLVAMDVRGGREGMADPWNEKTQNQIWGDLKTSSSFTESVWLGCFLREGSFRTEIPLLLWKAVVLQPKGTGCSGTYPWYPGHLPAKEVSVKVLLLHPV